MTEHRAPGATADASRAALEAVTDFLGGPRVDGRDWVFDLGEHLESNWGSVYGGATSAALVAVARAATPDRWPRSLHVQLLRSVPRGMARASAEVRHQGRTVAAVQVELRDQGGKLAVVGLVTMVTPEALAAEFDDTRTEPFRRKERIAQLAAGFTAPVQRSLHMLSGLQDDGSFVASYAENRPFCIDGTPPPVGHITLPWDELEHTGPEAACLSADAMTAPPILYSYIPNDVIGPNVDLSLRFTTAAATREVLSAGTMYSVHSGAVTIGIEVQAGDGQLARGLATSLLLARKVEDVRS
jgi:acyl-coenzyme A thioesterase PaaI-like protein